MRKQTIAIANKFIRKLANAEPTKKEVTHLMDTLFPSGFARGVDRWAIQSDAEKGADYLLGLARYNAEERNREARMLYPDAKVNELPGAEEASVRLAEIVAQGFDISWIHIDDYGDVNEPLARREEEELDL